MDKIVLIGEKERLAPVAECLKGEDYWIEHFLQIQELSLDEHDPYVVLWLPSEEEGGDPREQLQEMERFQQRKGVPIVFLGIQGGAFQARLPEQWVSLWLDDSLTPELLSSAIERASFRMRVAQKNQGKEQWLSRILPLIRDGIVVLDRKLRILYFNEAAKALLGFSEEVVGSSLFDTLGEIEEIEEQYPFLCEDVKRSLLLVGKKYALPSGLTLKRKGGDKVSLHVVFTPLFSLEGGVDGAVFVVQNQEAEQKVVKKFSHYSTADVLTGLLNRKGFEERVQHAIDSAMQRGTAHVLLFMDIDRFKIVNEVCGSNAGDQLLLEFAQLLRQTLPEAESFGRLGDDEFGALFLTTSLDAAYQYAHRLWDALRSFVYRSEDKAFNVEVSMSLIDVDAQSLSAGETINRAIEACYSAKGKKSNSIQVCKKDADSSKEKEEHMQWVFRCLQALEEELFSLVYQEIVPLKSIGERHRHYEVLLRMRDKEGALIPAGQFILVAEHYGLMPTIDRWVLSHFFSFASQSFPQKESCPLFSLNLSGRTLSDESILPFILHLLDTHPIEAQKVCFEITETAAMSDVEAVKHFLSTLKKRGCRFSLDDFGSGLSSFSYLKNFPVDYLKIDGSFIKNIAQDSKERSIAKAINDVGHALGLETIAEFVEDENILAILQELGVDHAQGYHYGKALAEEELPLLIRR